MESCREPVSRDWKKIWGTFRLVMNSSLASRAAGQVFCLWNYLIIRMQTIRLKVSGWRGANMPFAWEERHVTVHVVKAGFEVFGCCPDAFCSQGWRSKLWSWHLSIRLKCSDRSPSCWNGIEGQGWSLLLLVDGTVGPARTTALGTCRS